MINKCSKCNQLLDSNFKFCPNCAAPIPVEEKNEEIKIEHSETELEIEIVDCPTCGTENEASAEFCSACGIKFFGVPKKVLRGKEIEDSNFARQIAQQKYLKQNNAKVENQPDEEKSFIETLTPKKILGLFGVTLLIGFLVLLVSGVFDSPMDELPAQGQMGNQGNVHKHTENLPMINALKDSLKNNPNNTELILDLANLLNHSGFYAESLENYKRYQKFDPNNPDVLVDMGICYFELQNFSAADSLMKLAIKINPAHQTGYFNLGIVNLSQGRIDVAMEWMQKAVAIDSNSEVGKRAKHILETH